MSQFVLRSMPDPSDLHISREDLTDHARVHHTAEWRVKYVWTKLSPLEREMLAEWLRVASQVAQERLCADGIRRIQEIMAVDPHAAEPVRLSPRRRASKPTKAEPSAFDILGI